MLGIQELEKRETTKLSAKDIEDLVGKPIITFHDFYSWKRTIDVCRECDQTGFNEEASKEN